MQRTVHLRPGTSDQDVYDQIFRDGEYASIGGDPRFIIDAGGHIGLATVFLAQRFPGATIAVVEPDPTNLAVLQRNVAGLRNVHVHAGGLWSRKTRLDITNPTADSWAFRLAEGSGVEAFTVDEIMRHYGAETVDLLKMDIEGAEVEVLTNAASWIDRVEVLLVELHDRLRPGCRAALDSAIRAELFDERAVGEYVLLTRRARTSEANL
jgi:FkbM family methyltransferase